MRVISFERVLECIVVKSDNLGVAGAKVFADPDALMGAELDDFSFGDPMPASAFALSLQADQQVSDAAGRAKLVLKGSARVPLSAELPDELPLAIAVIAELAGFNQARRLLTTSISLATTDASQPLTQKPCTLLLTRGGTVRGVVLDQMNPSEPFPHAMVAISYNCFFDDYAFTYQYPQQSVWHTQADAQGRYAFSDLPPGDYRIEAYREGVPPAHQIDRMTRLRTDFDRLNDTWLKLEEGGETEQQLFLFKPGDVRFRLSHPAEDVRAYFWPEKEEYRRDWRPTQLESPLRGGGVLTPSDGVYTLHGVAPTDDRIAIRAKGFGESVFTMPPAMSSLDRDLGTLTLDEAAMVSARIVDASGRPIPNARAYITGYDSWGSDFITRKFETSHRDASPDAISGDDGRVSVTGLPSGEFMLVVMHDDFVGASREVRALSGEDLALGDVVLELGATLFGQITLPPELSPYLMEEGVSVAAMFGDEARHLNVDIEELIVQYVERAQCKAIVNADGSYEISGVPPVECVLVVSVSAEYRATQSVPFTLKAGERKRVDLAFPQPASISGRITFPDGSPAAGLTVYMDHDRGYTNSATTAANGDYEITGLSPRSYLLKIEVPLEMRKEENRYLRFEIKAGEALKHDEVLAMKGVRVFGKVLVDGEADNARIELLSLDQEAQNSERLTDFVRRDSGFNFPCLRPGGYRMLITLWTADERETITSRDIVVPADLREFEADVVINTVALEGRITGLDLPSPLLPKADVTFGLIDDANTGSDAYWYNRFRVAATAMGELKHARFPEGHYRVTLEVQGYKESTAVVHITRESHSFSIAIGAACGTLTARIKRVLGKEAFGEVPVEVWTHGTITLTPRDGGKPIERNFSADFEGEKDTIDELPPGDYAYLIQSPAFADVRGSVSIKALETTELELEVVQGCGVQLIVSAPGYGGGSAEVVSLRIFNAETGESIAKGLDENAIISDERDEMRFWLPIGNAGSYRITASLEGYGESEVTNTLAQSRQVTERIPLIKEE